MTYGLIYTIPFQTMLQKKNCVVEIEKEGYEGESTELIAAGTPFTVDIDDEEFLYTPTRFSTANLNVVGKDYLQSLFTTDYRQHRVTLLVDGHVAWCGFVKPEVYTQDYVSETFELEMECMSAMSVLEYIDFTTQGTEKKFVSLWSLLQKCISEAQARYEAVHIPFVYGRTKEQYTAGENVLKEMMISEQNFFDEDGKPMKLKEVLEEICKFLNWTCADWKGELYFVDMDHAGTYHKYDPTLTDKTDEAVNELSVQDVGFAGSDHSLDILPGYNKVTVRCSNYPVGQLLDFNIDYNSLSDLQVLPDYEQDNRVSHAKLLNPGTLDMYQYNPDLVDDINQYKDNADDLKGALPMQYCNYNMVEEDGAWKPDISDYSYTGVVRVRLKDSAGNMIGGDTRVLGVFAPTIAYPAGVFCINAEVKYLKQLNMSPLSKDAWGGDLRIGIKLFVGEKDFTTDEICLGTVSSKCSYMGFGPYDEATEYKEADNEKTLNMPYTGAQGKIIIAQNDGKILAGKLAFYMLASMYPSEVEKYGYMLQNLTVKFVPQDGLSTEDSDDRIYENVLNENYINELDDIELKISSYNDDGACYSKVLYQGGVSWIFDDYVSDNVYNHLLDKLMRPENLLISRIISHYSTTRYKLTEVLMNDLNLSPFTRMSDKYTLDKKYINCGGSIDFQKDSFSFIMIEI